MSQLKEQWRSGLKKIEKDLQVKEKKDPWFWAKVFFTLSIAFFFAGYFVGAVIEHKHAAKDIQQIFDRLHPEDYYKSITDPEIKEIWDKWNITTID